MRLIIVLTGLGLLALVLGPVLSVWAGSGGVIHEKELGVSDSDVRQIQYSASGHDVTRLPSDIVVVMAEELSDEERRILLNDGTEPPFCGTLLDNKKEGTYCCKLCGLPLFASDSKFTSGTGWPSFFRPVDPDHVSYIEDRSHGMVRTEIECTRCGGHLGHVFDDGPKPTGKRYCLNSASLDFFEKSEELPERSKPVETAVAYFAGGCFWGIEDRFQKTPGVLSAVSGYQNGSTPKPTYRQVCTGATGHAESVKVVYDRELVSYRELLETFFSMHDPTQVNRQGPDVGTQYRSAIFAADEEQLEEARAFLAEQAETERFAGRTIATELEMAETFWEAEEYHQDYHAKRGTTCGLPTYD